MSQSTSIKGHLPNTQGKQHKHTGNGYRENVNEQKRREKRKERFSDKQRTRAHLQSRGPTLKTAKPLSLADRITRDTPVQPNPQLEPRHSVSQGLRKQSRSKDMHFGKRKRARRSPTENKQTLQSEPLKEDGRAAVNYSQTQERPTIKLTRSKHNNSNQIFKNKDTSESPHIDTVTQDSKANEDPAALGASIVSAQAEQASKKQKASTESHESLAKEQIIPTKIVPTEQLLQIEQSVVAATVEQHKAQTLTKITDANVSGIASVSVSKLVLNRRMEEDDEILEEHERKRNRTTLYPSGTQPPTQLDEEQLKADQSKDSSLNIGQEDANTKFSAELVSEAFKPTDFAPVAPNPEVEYEVAEYDDYSVPILYSTLIKHDNFEYLLNNPSVELKQKALALIERGFKGKDFGRPREPKKGPAKVINDCDLYLRDSMIHVATESGTMLVSDYLKLAGIPDSTRVRFDGVKPAWAKVSFANRSLRRVDRASYWIPGPYPLSQIGPDILEMNRGDTVEVLELVPSIGEGWGRNMKTGKAGWFCYAHTADFMDPFPAYDWDGLYTAEHLAAADEPALYSKSMKSAEQSKKEAKDRAEADFQVVKKRWQDGGRKISTLDSVRKRAEDPGFETAKSAIEQTTSLHDLDNKTAVANDVAQETAAQPKVVAKINDEHEKRLTPIPFIGLYRNHKHTTLEELEDIVDWDDEEL